MEHTAGSEFLDLAEYREVSTPRQITGNIIKAASITVKGVQAIGAPSEKSDEPLIMLEKEGDRIARVEFLCKCGRSASVHLEYEQE